MSFEFARQLHQKAVAVDRICRLLEVSRSDYLAARRRRTVAPVVCEASVQLKAASAASECSFGTRRLRMAVASRGVVIGIFRSRRLMRRHGLRSAYKRKFVQTTDSKHALPISPNVLNRQFNPTPQGQLLGQRRDQAPLAALENGAGVAARLRQPR